MEVAEEGGDTFQSQFEELKKRHKEFLRKELAQSLAEEENRARAERRENNPERRRQLIKKHGRERQQDRMRIERIVEEHRLVEANAVASRSVPQSWHTHSLRQSGGSGGAQGLGRVCVSQSSNLSKAKKLNQTGEQMAFLNEVNRRQERQWQRKVERQQARKRDCLLRHKRSLLLELHSIVSQEEKMMKSLGR